MTTIDGGKTSCCVLTVMKVPVTGISISSIILEIPAGKQYAYQLYATVSPSDATNKSVIWNTSDPNISMVDNNGLVWGVKSGRVTITVTTRESGFAASCKVTVK